MASASSNIDDEDPSQPSFGAIFTDTQKSLEWFRAQGLIPQLTKCPTCSKDMKEFNKREREDGKAFHCSKCNKQLSLRHGSIFYKSTLPLPVLAYLIFYFATDVPAFIASRLLGPSVCYKTIIQWYYKFR